MEFGRNAPFLVMEDADIEEVVPSNLILTDKFFVPSRQEWL